MEVKHPATVLSVKGEEVSVSIKSQSACASGCDACGHKKSCLIFGSAEKIMVVRTKEAQDYKPGQKVTVTMAEKAGWTAVFLGYVLPLLLLLAALFCTAGLTGSEPLAAAAGLGVMAVYYVILFLNRNKVKKYFVFRINIC